MFKSATIKLLNELIVTLAGFLKRALVPTPSIVPDVVPLMLPPARDTTLLFKNIRRI